MWPFKKKNPEKPEPPPIKLPRRIVLTEEQADEVIRLHFQVRLSETLERDGDLAKMNMAIEHPDSTKNRMLLWRYIEKEYPETEKGKWTLDFSKPAHPAVIEYYDCGCYFSMH